MSKLLETARRQCSAGNCRKAVDTLASVEARLRLESHGFDADLAEARGLLDLATVIRDTVPDNPVRAQSQLLRSRAQAAIQHLVDPPSARRAAAEAEAVAAIKNCDVLGGDGLPPRAGQTWDLIFLGNALVLWSLVDQRVDVPYGDIVALEIGGPGEKRTGGGFFGGGFGLAGAATGMLVASALNLLTTGREIDTVVCLKTRTAELYVHIDTETPEQLRMRLSPVFTLLRQIETSGAGQRPPSPARSLVDELDRLADLHDRGKLTDDEFVAFKAKLME